MKKQQPAAADTSPTKPAITDTASAVSVVVGGAPLDIAAEVAALSQSCPGKTGGSAFFVGTVRGGDVLAMTLEHYPGMTERALADIARRAKQQWHLTAARICHRVGEMKPGDAIVFVGAAAAHRGAAFDACRQMTDLLKTRAPFWKKEQTAKGERWVVAKQSDTAAAAKWDK